MSEAASRPGAEGHRFGPDLSCSECGVRWDAHQADPRRCVDARDMEAEAEVSLANPKSKDVGLVGAVSAGIQARAVGSD
jgi:hypothetical protein